MRSIIFAVLVAIPVALVTWVLTRGQHPHHSQETPEETYHVGGVELSHRGASLGTGLPSPDPSQVFVRDMPSPSRKGSPASTPSQTEGAVDPDIALRGFFSVLPPGIRVKDNVAFYDRQTLFDYIDGAAPLFIERGFRRLGAAEMTTADGGELTCDIYDMARPENARAIFEKERSPAAKDVPGWEKAIAGPKSFVFYHGKYYVKLTAFDNTAEKRLAEVARALREQM